jgi:hypothetical protein
MARVDGRRPRVHLAPGPGPRVAGIAEPEPEVLGRADVGELHGIAREARAHPDKAADLGLVEQLAIGLLEPGDRQRRDDAHREHGRHTYTAPESGVE